MLQVYRLLVTFRNKECESVCTYSLLLLGRKLCQDIGLADDSNPDYLCFDLGFISWKVVARYSNKGVLKKKKSSSGLTDLQPNGYKSVSLIHLKISRTDSAHRLTGFT